MKSFRRCIQEAVYEEEKRIADLEKLGFIKDSFAISSDPDPHTEFRLMDANGDFVKVIGDEPFELHAGWYVQVVNTSGLPRER